MTQRTKHSPVTVLPTAALCNRAPYADRSRFSSRLVAGGCRALVALLVLLAGAYSLETAAQSATARQPKVHNLLGGSTPEFLDLARRVGSGSPDEKAEFARVALEEMGLAFTEEAEKAREQKPDPRKPYNEDKDPRKWAASTDAYAGRLFMLSDSVIGGAFVDVQVTQEGMVLISIDSGTVIVSGPHIDKPQLLEDRIIDRICLDPECMTLASTTFTPDTSPLVSSRWNFADVSAPVFTASNGLSFLFEDDTNLAAKERACTAVAQELSDIVQALKNLLLQKNTVDWNAVAVRPDAADATLQVLLINNAGDFIKLALPQLARTPFVLQSALPWVRSQVEGRYSQHYVQLPPDTFN